MNKTKKTNDLKEKHNDLLRSSKKILDTLLFDQTTGNNIRWGTDTYSDIGERFQEEKEIKASLITGWYDGFIRPRVDKDSETQLERTRNKAEVFTPSWIIKKQLDSVLEEMEDLSFEDFINTRWLEIACGEAPYMTNRYDMVSGESIGLEKRAGFIDEKFRRLNKKISKRKEWIDLAILIYKSSYGYEFQGDSLILARENLLLTFVDNYFYMFGEFPDNKLLIKLADIISKNVFQMDGLTYFVPYSEVKNKVKQLSMFEEDVVEENEPLRAKITLWNINKTVDFINIVEEGDKKMKFDVVIGNPPYQGAAKKQIYVYFYESGKKVGNIVNLIFPIGWQDPKDGNALSVLNKPSVKEDAQIMFINNIQNAFEGVKGAEWTNIIMWKRGHDNKLEGKQRIFTNGDSPEILKLLTMKSDIKKPNYIIELNKIVSNSKAFKSVESIVSSRKPYGLPTNLVNKISIKEYSIYKLKNKNEYFRVLSKYGFMFVNIDYYIPKKTNSFTKYKVFVPYAWGNWSEQNGLGGSYSDIYIGYPGDACLETFLEVGPFDTKSEAIKMAKYLMTQFLRALLYVNKFSQHSTTAFKSIPYQNFDEEWWNFSIEEINKNLFYKYEANEEIYNLVKDNIQKKSEENIIDIPYSEEKVK